MQILKQTAAGDACMKRVPSGENLYTLTTTSSSGQTQSQKRRLGRLRLPPASQEKNAGPGSVR